MRNVSKECFYKVGQTYAITICPSDKYQNRRDINRLSKWGNKLYEELLNYPEHGIDYILWFEISEPRNTSYDKYPRVHNHGMIKFRNELAIRKWLLILQDRLSVYGIVDIDSIDDMATWEEYCQKQQDIIKKPPLSNCLDLKTFKSKKKDRPKKKNKKKKEIKKTQEKWVIEDD